MAHGQTHKESAICHIFNLGEIFGIHWSWAQEDGLTIKHINTFSHTVYMIFNWEMENNTKQKNQTWAIILWFKSFASVSFFWKKEIHIFYSVRMH